MDLSGIPHPKINWDSTNLPDEWEKFQTYVELIFSGPLKEKSEQEKVSYLLLWVGEQGRQIYKTWTGISEEDSKKLNTYYDRFKRHVQPKLYPIFARFRFNNVVQGSDNIDAFVTRLRIRARDCNFRMNENTDITEDMIRDRIVFRCSEPKVREKLINEGDKLTMDKAIQIVQNFEYCQQQLHSMATSQAGNNVDAVKKSTKCTKKAQRQRSDQKKRTQWTCGRCGYNHDSKAVCSAKGKKCNKCNKLNHFAKVCKTKSVDFVNESDDECRGYSVDMVSASSLFTHSASDDQMLVNLQIGPKMSKMMFKIDTGSSANIIPFTQFQLLGIKGSLKPPDCKLISYSGEMLNAKGMINLNCRYRDSQLSARFYIVHTKSPPLIGTKTSTDPGLIKLTYSVDNGTNEHLTKDSVLREYSDLFKGIGTFPGKCHLHLKDNVTPTVNPPRRIPEALKNRLKIELDQMVKDKIIRRVTEPTDWVNSIVVVEKPKTGKLRICLEPKALNEAIRRPHFQMPTLDDITSKLACAKYFSILDITHAYWNVQLDEQSSLLTTFNTPFGRYCYLRLPFGISSSGDIFQQKDCEIFESLPGIQAIVDDTLVYGQTRTEHDQNLRNALNRAREKGICFNPDKCTIGVTEVSFFGHIISSTGLKPDPSKIEAILQLPVPDSREKLQTFLGMVNYRAKFAPNLAEVTNPLRLLLKKESDFIWDETQTRAFNKVKQLITDVPVLGYYDSNKELVLETDASKSGLGCCIFQDGRPIAYASKSLTKSECMYAQIEKELLTILYGCKRFHQFTYGRNIIVHCDHKPIESIMKKPLAAALLRLQRMLLQLQKYILVRHVSGKDIPVSDYLSRQSRNDTDQKMIEGLDLHVHVIRKQLFVTDKRLDRIKSGIESDMQMRALKRTIIEGWPEMRSNCDPKVLDYFNHRDELSVEDGLIFRGQRIIVPASLRNETLSQIHKGHMGVTKSVERAKDSLFWPGMVKQVTDYVLNCPLCLTHRNSNAKEPMIPSEFPDRPYQKLGADIFHFDRQNYLLTIDYYSRFFEVDLLPDMKSSTVIRKLIVHMSRNGICDVLITDNGPQFVSTEFHDFSKAWLFEHQTSSPRYPRGNGLAEKGVGIAKKLMKNAKDDKESPYVLFLEYRNTLLDCGYSPAQLLIGRRTKPFVPITSKALQPHQIDPKKVRLSVNRSKGKQKQNYDKSSKVLKPLCINDAVRIQLGKIWKPAKVLKKLGERSYLVQTRDGSTYRRNRLHLNQTNEDVSDICPFDLNILQNESSPSTPVQHETSPSSYQDKSYVTRSGRVVKENRRYTGEEWTT